MNYINQKNVNNNAMNDLNQINNLMPMNLNSINNNMPFFPLNNFFLNNNLNQINNSNKNNYYNQFSGLTPVIDANPKEKQNPSPIKDKDLSLQFRLSLSLQGFYKSEICTIFCKENELISTLIQKFRNKTNIKKKILNLLLIPNL